MILFYKHRTDEDKATHPAIAKSVIRPDMLHICLTVVTLATRLYTYILLARFLGVQTFGMLLLLQWLASAFLPLIGIGIDPISQRKFAHIQRQELPLVAAGVFHFLWRRQCRRILVYSLFSLPLACLLSFASRGVLALPLLLLASLVAPPLLLNSIITIALRSQGRYLLLLVLSTVSTLISFSLVVCTIHVPMSSTTRITVLLILPAFASTVALTCGLVALAHTLPLQAALPVGSLLKQRLLEATHIPVFHFITDIFMWRELPFLVTFLLLNHSANVFTNLSYYAFALLLCSRLIEVAPNCFIAVLLPLLARFFSRYRKRPFTVSRYDAFIKTTCYISFLATLLCTLLSLFCPQLILLSLGTAYLPMVNILRVLLIAVTCNSIATISFTHLEHYAHRVEQTQETRPFLSPPQRQLLQAYFFSQLGSVIAYIVLIIPCIAIWGIIGVTFASTIVRVSFALCSILLCQRLLRTAPNPFYSRLAPSRLPVAP